MSLKFYFDQLIICIIIYLHVHVVFFLYNLLVPNRFKIFLVCVSLFDSCRLFIYRLSAFEFYNVMW